MFFSRKELIDEETKYGLDIRLKWIIEEFGKDYLRNKKLVMDTDIFKGRFDAAEEALDTIGSRVIKIMDADEKNIQFVLSENNPTERIMQNKVHSFKDEGNYSGRYYESSNKCLIEIAEAELMNPISFVATLAHEIAHYKLLYEKRMTENDELLTDILPTFFGFGIFCSSSALVYEKHEGLGTCGWSVSRHGYISEYEYGYILAKWSIFNSIDPKSFMNYLKPNVKDSFRRSYKKLRNPGN